MHGDGSVDRLHSGGIILGPTPSASYSIGIAEMKPGELLVLYTDGIVEAHTNSSDEEYGEDRLVHVVRAVRHLDPVAVVDRIFSDVGDFGGGDQQSDDQTVLIVKRRLAAPEEAPA